MLASCWLWTPWQARAWRVKLLEQLKPLCFPFHPPVFESGKPDLAARSCLALFMCSVTAFYLT